MELIEKHIGTDFPNSTLILLKTSQFEIIFYCDTKKAMKVYTMGDATANSLNQFEELKEYAKDCKSIQFAFHCQVVHSFEKKVAIWIEKNFFVKDGAEIAFKDLLQYTGLSECHYLCQWLLGKLKIPDPKGRSESKHLKVTYFVNRALDGKLYSLTKESIQKNRLHVLFEGTAEACEEFCNLNQ